MSVASKVNRLADRSRPADRRGEMPAKGTDVKLETSERGILAVFCPELDSRPRSNRIRRHRSEQCVGSILSFQTSEIQGKNQKGRRAGSSGTKEKAQPQKTRRSMTHNHGRKHAKLR